MTIVYHAVELIQTWFTFYRHLQFRAVNTKVPHLDKNSDWMPSRALCPRFSDCFGVLVASLGEGGAGFFLIVHLFLCLFCACVCFVLFLFILVSSWVGCGLWLWHTLDLSINLFGLSVVHDIGMNFKSNKKKARLLYSACNVNIVEKVWRLFQ